MTKTLSKTLVILALVSCLSPKIWAADDDPIKLAPRNYRVRLDNDKVRVLDVWLRPGAKTPMHSHPDSTVYVVSGGVAKFTDDKGQSTTIRMRPGQTTWRPAEHHMVQNVGMTTIHVVQTEIKGMRIF